MQPDPEALAELVVETIQTALGPVLERLAVMQARVDRLAVTEMAVIDLRERAAVLETRPPTPGPPGQDGAPGPPGHDGADGKPGLEWCGVFVDGQSYDCGQLVTWAGAAWHCNELTTTKPGEGSKAWTLMVKRGRDGKDGKDGAVGPAGPTGKDWQQVYDDTRRR